MGETSSEGLEDRDKYLSRTGKVGKKLSDLLELARSPLSHEFGLLQFAVGSVVAMRLFLDLNQTLAKSARWETTSSIAQKIRDGRSLNVATEHPNWEAGFHFNNAILRIMAVTERALRILNDVTCPDTDVKYGRLKTGNCSHVSVPTRNADWWKPIDRLQAEVNRLKHKQGNTQRLVEPLTAIEAMERMVDLCEAAINRSEIVGHI